MFRYQNDTSPIDFLLVDSTDHLTGKTGLAPTLILSKSGGAFGAPAGAVAEIANGWYKLTPGAADVGTAGDLAIHVTAPGADPVDILRVIVPDPAASVPSAMLVTPANKLATDASGFVTVGTIAAAALTAVRTTLEAAGSILDTIQNRVTAAVATKLQALLVDGTGQVTVGSIATAALNAITTTIQAAGTTLATLLGRVPAQVAANSDMQTVLGRVPGQVASNADMQVVLTRVPSLVATDGALQADVTSILNAIASLALGSGGSVDVNTIAAAVRTNLAIELARIDAPISQVPALAGAAARDDIVATSDWHWMRAAAKGDYDYVAPAGGGAGVGQLTLNDVDGAALVTFNVTVDAQGNIAHRAS